MFLVDAGGQEGALGHEEALPLVPAGELFGVGRWHLFAFAGVPGPGEAGVDRVRPELTLRGFDVLAGLPLAQQGEAVGIELVEHVLQLADGREAAFLAGQVAGRVAEGDQRAAGFDPGSQHLDQGRL